MFISNACIPNTPKTKVTQVHSKCTPSQCELVYLAQCVRNKNL